MNAAALQFDRSDDALPLQRHPHQYPSNQNTNPLHRLTHSVPSPRPKHGEDEAAMEYQTAPRNLELPKWNEELIDVRKTLSSHWTKEVPQYRHAAKEVAPTIRASQATVESMRQNGVPEAMARLVFMCRHYPEFRAQFQKMIDPRYLLDPTQERVVHDMIMVMVRR